MRTERSGKDGSRKPVAGSRESGQALPCLVLLTSGYRLPVTGYPSYGCVL
jgi:hypothetical protein